MTNKYTREQIQEATEGLGYKYFSNGEYNINIIGIRNSNTNGVVTNKFDDLITVSYKCEHGGWIYNEYPCTTDPGDDWMENPWIDKIGCAVLKPGQYKGSHKLRLHSGKYLALGQKENVTVYRDNNRNDKYEFDESTCDVNKWSAGCQVIASNDDWFAFLEICQTARESWGNSFSYTLIESKNIK